MNVQFKLTKIFAFPTTIKGTFLFQNPRSVKTTFSSEHLIFVIHRDSNSIYSMYYMLSNGRTDSCLIYRSVSRYSLEKLAKEKIIFACYSICLSGNRCNFRQCLHWNSAISKRFYRSNNLAFFPSFTSEHLSMLWTSTWLRKITSKLIFQVLFLNFQICFFEPWNNFWSQLRTDGDS